MLRLTIDAFYYSGSSLVHLFFYFCDITGISSSNILKGIEVLQDDFCSETPIASEFAGLFSKIRNSVLGQAFLVCVFVQYLSDFRSSPFFSLGW